MDSMQKRPKFYHASLGFPSKKRLSGRARLCYKSARRQHQKEGDEMTRKTAFFSALCSAALVAGCATEAPKPAPKPEAAAPAPAPAPVATPRAAEPVKPAPAPVAAPKKPAVLTVTSTELFEFNKATLTAEARTKLDNEVVSRAKDFGNLTLVHVDGHADRLGSPQYNQKLSEKRAEAVRAYLVSKGFDGAKIETLGSGKTNPVKSCPDQKDRKALIQCLEANRRVVVEVKGTPR
jgi:OOP family OmpA-OmpF porin